MSVVRGHSLENKMRSRGRPQHASRSNVEGACLCTVILFVILVGTTLEWALSGSASDRPAFVTFAVAVAILCAASAACTAWLHRTRRGADDQNAAQDQVV